MLYCLYYSARRNKFRNQKLRIKELIDPYISQSILTSMETEETNLRLPGFEELQQRCHNAYNRKVIIEELILARKSLSGQAAETVRQLYTSLQLQTDSEKKLSSYKWHKKAKGIQELSLMQQRQYWKNIYRLTDHHNEHVRMEAQAGVVRLLGFIGLRFLNTASYQLTEWQQINLLYLLQSMPAADFKGIERWLHSQNASVVIFALKLVSSFRRYELHDLVMKCLHRREPAIRMQAFRTLGNIYREDTAERIIHQYAEETYDNKLEALKTLGKIGAEEVAPFLVEETGNADQQIRMEAARALLQSTPAASEVLQQKAIDDQSWNTILAQLENEIRA
ncbi:HEAT repeat domain-containing protein [Pseudoflavitalea sp. G-6-1-2]|uniref:HEAT repeat domain-containing protein n=1 Tax=Pseudoflavitalea sp. G-6-1-2 TaxID=2728841 RepID=UPI00146A62C7|nr:HEAT repeat domain-containing protein [Pseudoflavitalea sp. G-6-1-2]NML20117.1 HEAT repeat domain-containing protein [Pseudoflavitalea sp. G-6-1-2]